MVKILLDDLMTGACHAPVDSRQREGAVKFGRDWAIPVDAIKPEDKRVKSGEYRDWRKRTKINS